MVRMRTLSAAVVVLAVSLLTACGSGSSGTAGSGSGTVGGSSAKRFTIGYVPPTVAPFETAMRDGMEQQAKKLGMNFEVAGGQFDPSVQVAAVDTLLARGIDVLLIQPLDQQSIQPALDRARAKHIPIVVWDSPDAHADVNFQTNDEAATAALAKYAASKIGKPCHVAIMEGVVAVPILKARNDGLAKGATDAGCDILDKQTNTDDTPQAAGQIAQVWKTRFGSGLGGVLTASDPWAVAAAAQTSGGFHPVIVGVNGDADAIAAIKQGRLAATAALPSPEIGNGMVYAANELLHGKKVPPQIAVDYVQVTPDNAGTYKSYAERTKGPMTVSFLGDKLHTQLAP